MDKCRACAVDRAGRALSGHCHCHWLRQPRAAPFCCTTHTRILTMWSWAATAQAGREMITRCFPTWGDEDDRVHPWLAASSPDRYARPWPEASASRPCFFFWRRPAPRGAVAGPAWRIPGRVDRVKCRQLATPTRRRSSSRCTCAAVSWGLQSWPRPPSPPPLFLDRNEYVSGMDRVDLVPPTRHGACSVHRTARADVDRRPVAAVRDTGRREGNPCTSLGPASGWVIIRQTYCVTERMPIWLSPAGRTLVVVARNEGREKK